jgi:hypothetical protein
MHGMAFKNVLTAQKTYIKVPTLNYVQLSYYSLQLAGLINLVKKAGASKTDYTKFIKNG